MNKITVSIGIPAYNEEANIKRLLKSLLSQKQDNFILKEIVVVSDGSTDHTVKEINSLKSSLVRVINDGLRKGRAERINDIFSLIDADIAVIIDADTLPTSNQVFSNLIEPFIQQSNVMLVSGNTTPTPNLTFFQKILKTGRDLWRETIYNTRNSDMYLCGGACVALRKDLYSQVKYPLTGADDVYPYLFAMSKGYGFKHATDATIYYQLPTNYADYYKQITRYLNSDSAIVKIFGADFVQKYYVITPKVKLKFFLRSFMKNPFWTAMYSLLLLAPKLSVFFYKRDTKGVWQTSESTKQFNH